MLNIGKKIINYLLDLFDFVTKRFKMTPSSSENTPRMSDSQDTLPSKPYLYRLINAAWPEMVSSAIDLLIRFIPTFQAKVENLFKKDSDTQPFKSHAVIVVHGLRGHKSNFYTIINKINEKFGNDSPDFHAVDPVNNQHINDDVREISEKIIELSAYYNTICLIGHSRGGRLVSQIYNQLDKNSSAFKKIHSIISISSPEKEIEIVETADEFINSIGQIGHAGHLFGIRSFLRWLIDSVFDISKAHVNFTRKLQQTC